MNNVDCFKCHNIGHMARDCKLTWALTQARTVEILNNKHIFNGDYPDHVLLRNT